MSGHPRLIAQIVRAMRPRQWIKNLLVVTAPLAAGVLAEPDVLRATVLAFVAFTCVAAGIYLVNDVVDAPVDRLHPVKRHRPIASGALSERPAIVIAFVVFTAGFAVAGLVNTALVLTLGIYAILQVAYALALKKQPVLDLAVVTSGFLLRAIAGGVAAGVPLSQWFLLVTAFGSLFVVAGKRYSELRTLGADAGTRSTLLVYSESYLRFVWSTAAAVTVTAYSLWAFEIRSESPIDWQAISIAPFVLGLMRYAVDVDRGLAGEPEDAVLRDPVLLVIAAGWVAVFAIGVYAG